MGVSLIPFIFMLKKSHTTSHDSLSIFVRVSHVKAFVQIKLNKPDDLSGICSLVLVPRSESSGTRPAHSLVSVTSSQHYTINSGLIY